MAQRKDFGDTAGLLQGFNAEGLNESSVKSSSRFGRVVQGDFSNGFGAESLNG